MIRNEDSFLAVHNICGGREGGREGGRGKKSDALHLPTMQIYLGLNKYRLPTYIANTTWPGTTIPYVCKKLLHKYIHT